MAWPGVYVRTAVNNYLPLIYPPTPLFIYPEQTPTPHRLGLYCPRLCDEAVDIIYPELALYCAHSPVYIIVFHVQVQIPLVGIALDTGLLSINRARGSAPTVTGGVEKEVLL